MRLTRPKINFVLEKMDITMITVKGHRRIVKTNFIEFNASKCEACWKCISVCPNEVIGKIDLFFHKHARIVKKNACKGCLKCI
jgi:Pyruvate/2-oxoacid:ferredoxin oxidoreductase delta subunit